MGQYRWYRWLILNSLPSSSAHPLPGIYLSAIVMHYFLLVSTLLSIPILLLALPAPPWVTFCNFFVKKEKSLSAALSGVPGMVVEVVGVSTNVPGGKRFTDPRGKYWSSHYCIPLHSIMLGRWQELQALERHRCVSGLVEVPERTGWNPQPCSSYL